MISKPLIRLLILVLSPYFNTTNNTLDEIQIQKMIIMCIWIERNLKLNSVIYNSNMNEEIVNILYYIGMIKNIFSCVFNQKLKYRYPCTYFRFWLKKWIFSYNKQNKENSIK